MSQGITIKGKTPGGQSIEIQVDDLGRLLLAGEGLAPGGFASWEVSAPSSTTDLIEYFDIHGTVIRSILVTFTSTAKSSISRAEIV